MRSTKKIFLLFSFFVTAHILSAQYTWSPQVSGTNNNLYSVFFTTNSFNAAVNGFAVGTGGTIRTTSDFGSTWTGQVSGTIQTLYEVYFVNDSTGWISGGSGTILHTSDTGNTWTPQISNTTQTLWCIYFSSELYGFACGAGGTILATVDGGITWAPQTSNVTGNLWAVRMVNDSTGWMVGDNGVILKTTDYGANWNAQTSNVAGVLWSITTDACNPGEAFASGNGGAIIHTTDGGATWSPQTSGTGVFLHWISFDNPLCYGFVVGQSGEIRASADFGNTWNANTSNTTNDLRSVFMTVPLDLLGWAVGDGGVIRVLQWPLGIHENEIQHISVFPNPSDGKFIFDAGIVVAENASVEIFDVLGNKIQNIHVNSTKAEIDLSGQPKGIYFYKFIVNGKISATGKLMLSQ
ncbi:MAG: YCF48-related protein [Bacteroidota bacterium]|nr:YCF48-related protein [Bacteroidota bacterium]